MAVESLTVARRMVVAVVEARHDGRALSIEGYGVDAHERTNGGAVPHRHEPTVFDRKGRKYSLWLILAACIMFIGEALRRAVARSR